MAKRRTEYRFHGVTMLTTSHKDIRRIKRTDAQPSITATSFGSRLPADRLPEEEPAGALPHGDGRRLWLGYGRHLLRALWCDVISVDADKDVFPYLQANAANGVDVTAAVKISEDHQQTAQGH